MRRSWNRAACGRRTVGSACVALESNLCFLVKRIISVLPYMVAYLYMVTRFWSNVWTTSNKICYCTETTTSVPASRLSIVAPLMPISRCTAVLHHFLPPNYKPSTKVSRSTTGLVRHIVSRLCWKPPANANGRCGWYRAARSGIGRTFAARWLWIRHWTVSTIEWSGLTCCTCDRSLSTVVRNPHACVLYKLADRPAKSLWVGGIKQS